MPSTIGFGDIDLTNGSAVTGVSMPAQVICLKHMNVARCDSHVPLYMFRAQGVS